MHANSVTVYPSSDCLPFTVQSHLIDLPVFLLQIQDPETSQYSDSDEEPSPEALTRYLAMRRHTVGVGDSSHETPPDVRLKLAHNQPITSHIPPPVPKGMRIGVRFVTATFNPCLLYKILCFRLNWGLCSKVVMHCAILLTGYMELDVRKFSTLNTHGAQSERK